MSLKIQDGRGKGTLASVSTVQRLNVSSKNAPRAYYISRDDAECYTWTSSYSASTGDEIIYIQNDSKTKDLYIDQINVGAVASSGLFTVYQATGTATGTIITGVNLNLTSGNVAAATAKGNASVGGAAIGDRIISVRCATGAGQVINLENALILGFNDAIIVTYVGSTGIADIAIRGYYEGAT